MQIIGLSGKKQSGKDELAKYIKEILMPTKVYRLAFADELKYELAEAIGCSIPYLEEHKEQLRLLLQAWGTEFRRNLIDKDYWVKKLAFKITRLPNDVVVVIPDVRFLNEAELITKVGGYMIRVDRSSMNTDNHISETELDNYPFNFIIDNNSTLEELRNQIEKFLELNQIKC